MGNYKATRLVCLTALCRYAHDPGMTSESISISADAQFSSTEEGEHTPHSSPHRGVSSPMRGRFACVVSKRIVGSPLTQSLFPDFNPRTLATMSEEVTQVLFRSFAPIVAIQETQSGDLS
ncbi:unnamed protein product [Leuciscus chuanchicus]